MDDAQNRRHNSSSKKLEKPELLKLLEVLFECHLRKEKHKYDHHEACIKIGENYSDEEIIHLLKTFGVRPYEIEQKRVQHIINVSLVEDWGHTANRDMLYLLSKADEWSEVGRLIREICDLAEQYPRKSKIETIISTATFPFYKVIDEPPPSDREKALEALYEVKNGKVLFELKQTDAEAEGKLSTIVESGIKRNRF